MLRVTDRVSPPTPDVGQRSRCICSITIASAFPPLRYRGMIISPPVHETGGEVPTEFGAGCGVLHRASLSGDWEGTHMSELQAEPCDFDRHQKAGTCDCWICGWHVWDSETVRDGAGQVISDGSVCPAGRPRASQYGG